MSEAGARVRQRARVQGTVQGVGFRPFVYRLARARGLGGYVLNDEHGVLLEVEGPDADVAEFQQRLLEQAPPLAVIDRVSWSDVAPQGSDEFEILASQRSGPADAPITARQRHLCGLPGRARLAG